MFEAKMPCILIVDRRLSTLTLLGALLRRSGYRVTTCYSSDEALKAVAGQGIDLVIAGRCGPEGHGAALIPRIKTLSPETNVLLFTDSTEDSVVTDALAAGADGLLRRSYSESQMIRNVARLLHVVQT